MNYLKSISLIVLFLMINSSIHSRNDSLLKTIKVGYFLFNDNNPIDNASNDYDNRKRDDHGLTYALGYVFEAELNLFKKAITTINFTDHSALYTRGLGTTSILTQDDPNYEDYTYLLDKHPDWKKLYINDQISYSKNVKEFSITNRYNQFSIGASMRYSSIYSGKSQKMADFQRKVHSILGSRNYVHIPFTDSSIFRGANIYYFSFATSFSYEKEYINNEDWNLRGSLGARLWFNSISEYGIPSFSPEISTNWKLGYGRVITERERKWNLDYLLLYEPNEIIQRYSDPGTDGFHSFALSVNFVSKNHKEKARYFLYTLSPYTVYMPIARQDDVTMSYCPRPGDLRIVESFLNLTVSLRFNK